MAAAVPSTTGFESTVFINCPFDDAYAPLFEAIVFAVIVCGFNPSSARERRDSGEIRLDKIVRLIAGARYSVHDLSRTQLDGGSQLPRFNMPLELGVDIGCRRFGPRHISKTALIFESEPHQYQKYISDIAGQDIEQHRDDPARAIKAIRNWLRTESGKTKIPGPSMIVARYATFRAALPAISKGMSLNLDELTFVDYCEAVRLWADEGSFRLGSTSSHLPTKAARRTP